MSKGGLRQRVTGPQNGDCLPHFSSLHIALYLFICVAMTGQSGDPRSASQSPPHAEIYPANLAKCTVMLGMACPTVDKTSSHSRDTRETESGA